MATGMTRSAASSVTSRARRLGAAARLRNLAAIAVGAGVALVLLSATVTGDTFGRPAAAGCEDPDPAWLACEDFEAGGLGWQQWFSLSPFTECLGCEDGENDPARIRLVSGASESHTGNWALYMPAEASAGYQGASLTFRSCADEKRPGCDLDGYDELFFRTWVRLAEDHEYVHHFLSLAGTRTDRYWDCDGNAGCRPNGRRAAGTALDLNRDRELFFYTYFPEMHCDRGGYCSGSYAQRICDGCARKEMPCDNGLECCWGNHFGPVEPVILARGEWTCLELNMELNAPGQADGSMSFWVNGELAHRQTGMHWRDIAELQLNKAWLQHYIAAGDADKSNRVWFDDVVVSTERIGCGQLPQESRTPPSTPAPSESATSSGPATASPQSSPAVTAPPSDNDLYLPALEASISP